MNMLGTTIGGKMFTRQQQGLIAQAMRDARPIILDSPEAQAQKSNAWLAARDVYVNACTELCDMLARNVGGFDTVERQIFLSNCRAIKLEPFTCTCGQHITDGKPCGCGQRDALGIV